MRNGAAVAEDLAELWRRIVFNICVSNTDDHLRNHGFLLVPNEGCRKGQSVCLRLRPKGEKHDAARGSPSHPRDGPV